ncbi:hypothetical protein PPACK8108_LOCUS4582 [Phakopsora pachyrhizi]|uniref:Uncharacterized protein n=1 Tax=Phakopsora pachyrhizi TaxID=170000 RepID=A0AAV0AM79_PHAPC|nr:hypothetical protein PPACK8108_LOCUS4582 [Phakopsora pachyrhizi]
MASHHDGWELWVADEKLMDELGSRISQQQQQHRQPQPHHHQQHHQQQIPSSPSSSSSSSSPPSSQLNTLQTTATDNSNGPSLNQSGSAQPIVIRQVISNPNHSNTPHSSHPSSTSTSTSTSSSEPLTHSQPGSNLQPSVSSPIVTAAVQNIVSSIPILEHLSPSSKSISPNLSLRTPDQLEEIFQYPDPIETTPSHRTDSSSPEVPKNKEKHSRSHSQIGTLSSGPFENGPNQTRDTHPDSKKLKSNQTLTNDTQYHSPPSQNKSPTAFQLNANSPDSPIETSRDLPKLEPDNNLSNSAQKSSPMEVEHLPAPLSSIQNAPADLTRSNSPAPYAFAYEVYDRQVSRVQPASTNPRHSNPPTMHQRNNSSVIPSQPKPIKPQPPQEVCLECMMRDRDMADVDVVGPAVWARKSDADFEEALAAEMNLDDQDESSESTKDGGNFHSSSRLRSSVSKLSSGGHEATDDLAVTDGSNTRLNRHRSSGLNNSSLRGSQHGDGSSNIHASQSISSLNRSKPRRKPIGLGQPLTTPALKAWTQINPPASSHRWKTLQLYLKEQRHYLELEHRAKLTAQYETERTGKQIRSSIENNLLRYENSSRTDYDFLSTTPASTRGRNNATKPRSSSTVLLSSGLVAETLDVSKDEKEASRHWTSEAKNRQLCEFTVSYKFFYLRPVNHNSRLNVLNGVFLYLLATCRASTSSLRNGYPQTPLSPSPYSNQPGVETLQRSSSQNPSCKNPYPPSPSTRAPSPSRFSIASRRSGLTDSLRPFSNWSRSRRSGSNSVFSFAASGSMIDMHLGLSQDRHYPQEELNTTDRSGYHLRVGSRSRAFSSSSGNGASAMYLRNRTTQSPHGINSNISQGNLNEDEGFYPGSSPPQRGVSPDESTGRAASESIKTVMSKSSRLRSMFHLPFRRSVSSSINLNQALSPSPVPTLLSSNPRDQNGINGETNTNKMIRRGEGRGREEIRFKNEMSQPPMINKDYLPSEKAKQGISRSNDFLALRYLSLAPEA